jgi:hypothetical protein
MTTEHAQSPDELTLEASPATPSNSSNPHAGPGKETKLDKSLRNTHFVVSAVILGVAGQLWINGDGVPALGFMLAALSLMLTSFGALNLTDLPVAARRGIIILSLVVASLGAYTFVEGLREAELNGPGIYDVTFDFSAVKYQVEGISPMPCTPQNKADPLQVTCIVIVTPLAAQQPANGQDASRADAPAATQREVATTAPASQPPAEAQN